MTDDGVKIELSDDFVCVELDGVRAELRGTEQVRGVKRAVAQQLLSAIGRVPELNEQMRQADLARGRVGDTATGLAYAPRAEQGAIIGAGRILARQKF